MIKEMCFFLTNNSKPLKESVSKDFFDVIEQLRWRKRRKQDLLTHQQWSRETWSHSPFLWDSVLKVSSIVSVTILLPWYYTEHHHVHGSGPQIKQIKMQLQVQVLEGRVFHWLINLSLLTSGLRKVEFEHATSTWWCNCSTATFDHLI